jgi:hypothetical protein
VSDEHGLFERKGIEDGEHVPALLGKAILRALRLV